MTFTQIVFLLAAGISLFAGVMVVTTRRIMHAALWLILALGGIAILFALLELRFFTIVQLVIYIGAIAIMIIFSVMLTHRSMSSEVSQVNRGWWAAVLAGLMLFMALMGVMSFWQPFWTVSRSITPGGEDIGGLGLALIDPQGFALPFEISSVLLMATMIGAIYIAVDRRIKPE
jgi:NADH-quinone oxidoreductase subunit J